MTVETLHDALNLLPTDLVAAVDKHRSHGTRTLHWQRLAAMAACLVLVFCAGSFAMLVLTPMGSSKAHAEAPAAVMQDALMEDAPMEAEREIIETAAAKEELGESFGAASGGTADNGSRPLPEGVLDILWVETPVPSAANVSGMPSVRALITGRQEWDAYVQGSALDLTALQAAGEAWDASWFENHDVLVVTLAAAAAEDLEMQEVAGQWTIRVPSAPTDGEVKDYHILIVTEKGRIPSADAVTVVFA